LKRFYCFALFIALFAFSALLLNMPVPVGLADNTDYQRITLPFGMTTDDHLRFYYFQTKFYYTSPFHNLSELMDVLLKPDHRLPGNFRTTQFAVMRLALLLNGFTLWLKSGEIHYFDIRALGIVLLLLHSAAIVLVWHSFPIQSKPLRILFLLIIVLVYCDFGYVLYYHSLYAEAVTLSSFLLWLAVLLYMIQSGKRGYFILGLYFLCGMVFIGSRIANIPLGIFIAAFSLCFLDGAKKTAKRVFIIAGICSILAVSLYYYRAIPEWMKKINNYHSIFFGVLKDSDNPAKDLATLNIDTKYAVLAGTHGFMDHYGFDIFSEEFQHSVYDKAGPVQVSLFYLKNPKRLLQKLKVSSEAGLMIRPPYLGNFAKKNYEEIVKFSYRFSLWEGLRKKLYGHGFFFFAGFLTACSALVLYRRFTVAKTDKAMLWSVRLRAMLVLFAAIQWVLPVIGIGECDLSKHMFLFNLLFDTVLILFAGDMLWLLEQKTPGSKTVVTGMVLFIFVFAAVLHFSPVNKGKVITFGRYGGKEITWEVLEETDTYYIAVSENIVDNRAFSSGNSNLWADSDIRMWLNDANPGGFLYEFTETERNKILPVPMKTILPPDSVHNRDVGEQPHHWVSTPGYVTQNYEKAYGVIREERVFLLSVKQWEAFLLNRRKGERFWLRTPYAFPGTVRVVGEDGYVSHKRADMESIGVLPAIYIQK